MTYQIMRFCVVGGLATAVHMLVAAALIHAGFSFSVWLTNFLAFVVAFWVSFLGHRHFTFKSEGSIAKFLVAGLTGLAVNNSCLTVTFWATANDLASIALAAVMSPVVVFLLSRFWVFK